MHRRTLRAFVIGILIFPSLFLGSFFVYAQSEVEKLQSQIAERNDRLAEIESEIAEYESALEEVGAEKSTLQSAINSLSLERKKVLADISYTQNQISNTDLEISKLTIEINEAERDIIQNESAIAEIIRTVNLNDNDSMIEVFLTHENLSEFWRTLEDLDSVKQAMGKQVDELQIKKVVLEDKKIDETERRDDLVTLKAKYNGQQAVLQHNKEEKDELLRVTQNEEASYQNLLQIKLDAREQLRREVQDIESQLQFILDPNTIPTPGTPVFIWPLDNVVITQNFGYTKFALSGAYNGSQHNGMDLGAPVGTPLYAPLTGTVRNVGNTDAVPGCYSWGKWLLIDHPNGLSTMFAHLSHVGVTPGQKVSTGDIVGYVGNTGYSTGPHLHYTLYVSDAVEVMRFNEFKTVTGCGAALSPFSAIEGYLNPRDYLPPL